jgi:hypothetical protein
MARYNDLARRRPPPDPRGDAVRKAAGMIRDGAQLADVADVLRAGAEAYIEIALTKLSAVDLIGVRLAIGMLPEAVQRAGLIPTSVPTPPADPDGDLWTDAARRVRSLNAVRRI